MQPRPPFRRRVLSSPYSWLLLASLGCSVGAPGAGAADRYWANGGAAFDLPINWLGGVPGAADRAIFNAIQPQPVVSSAASILGATFYSAGATLTGPGPLSLLSNVTNTDFGAALFAAAPGITTVSVPLVLGLPAATGTAGFTSILGADLVVSGDISGSRALQKVGSGTITLAGNNSFTGGVNGNGTNGNFGLSRLNLNSDTALGTGTFTIGQGNGGSTFGNTSGAPRTLANAVALTAGGGVTTNWDLPVNGSGDLTFTGLATLTGAASATATINVQSGTLTLRGGIAESAATQGFTKSGGGTLVVAGAVANTGTVTFSGGGFTLDMSQGGTITNTALPLTINNTIFGIKGVGTGLSNQTLASASFSARTSIVLDGNGGAGTTLTTGSTWTRNTASTLAIRLIGNAAVAATPAVSLGGLVIGTGTAAFATVTDGTGTGFATVSDSKVVRFTGSSTLTAVDSGNTTNFITRVGDADYLGGNTLTFGAGNRAFNTLHLDGSGGVGTVDLNATSLTLTDRSILATGANGYTIQNGVLGGGVELIVHQFATQPLTVAATIGGVASNGASVTKDGPGTLILAATNLYTGATIVNEGTLAITGSLRGAATATGSTAATAGHLSLQAVGAISQSVVSVFGNGVLTQTVANALTGTASLTVNGFVGGATANLSQANTHSGQTLLQNGTLNLGHGAAIGTGTLNLSGGRIDNVSGAPMTLVNNNPITVGASFIFNGTNSLHLGSGAVNLGTAVRTIAVLGQTLTLGGSASGTGGGIIKIGAGTLALNATNNYTGATTVDGGVLLLNDVGALPGGIGATGGASVLTIRGGVIGLGATDFLRPLGTGASEVQFTAQGGGFAAFGGNRVVNLGGVSAPLTWAVGGFLPNSSNGTSTTFVLGAPSATGTVDFQNPIALGSATVLRHVQVEDGSAAIDARFSGGLSHLGGTVSLTKLGAGTLELASVNTYNGVTSVAAGRLLVTGELSGTSAVNVAGGAGLGGNGGITTTLNGNVTLLAGSTLAPGNGPGVLTVNVGFGALDLSGAASGTGAFQFELGTVSDQVLQTGGFLNIGSGVMNFDDFAFSAVGGFGQGIYTLFDSPEQVQGSLGGNLTGLIAGLPGTLAISPDGSDVILTVVPEPTGVALFLSGLGMLAMARRRREA